MTIPRPDIPRNHPDRFDSCQMALEGELIELVVRVCETGWCKDEVLMAITEVVDNMALARREDIAITVEMHVRQLMKKRDV